MGLYLDDLAPGMEFTSEEYEITPENIIAFATQFDPQPFHTDPDAAKSTFFGGLAASGWHTAAITMRLVVTGGPQLTGGTIGAGGELKWPTPTRPGDRLHAQVRIESVTPSKSRPDRGIVVMRIETLNQDGEVRQIFIVNGLAFRRSDRAEPPSE
jgi:acyl dehydratase